TEGAASARESWPSACRMTNAGATLPGAKGAWGPPRAGELAPKRPPATPGSRAFKFKPPIAPKGTGEPPAGGGTEGAASVVLLGPHGVGKPHLAVALGLKV